MRRARQKIWFVYRQAQLHRGSVVMRAHQLCEVARAHLGGMYEFDLLRMPSNPALQRLWVAARPRGGIYFVTKACTRKLKPENALRLQSKADGVCFDHVDSDLRAIRTAGADIHLCCSYGQLRAFERLQRSGADLPGKAMLLLHNADARLYGKDFPGVDRFSPVYCGTERVGHLPPEVRARISLLDASDAGKFGAALERLPGYNFHYCLRSDDDPEDELHKPFTKGFTAAVCRSNVLAHRDTTDVIEFLGEDYPFLVDSLAQDEVVGMLDRAAAAFAGPEWQLGLDRMEEVAERISPRAIAAQIETVLKELGA